MEASQPSIKSFKRFKINRLIASGGMGDVYEAIDTSNGSRVALKLMPIDIEDKLPDAQRGFKLEAQSLERLDSENVVKIIETGTFEGVPYIVMEFLEGRLLSEITDNFVFGVDEAFPIMLQLLEGLSACHKLRIIHRDIKPSNIIITDAGTAKILDFGIVKDLEGSKGEQTTQGLIMGSFKYLSPEIANCLSPTPRSDIWALGASADH